MDHKLRADLETAAKGFAAVYGDGAPNLFAKALAEIKRLDAIEVDIKHLFDIDPAKLHLRPVIGKRLAEAVGALPKCFVPKAAA